MISYYVSIIFDYNDNKFHKNIFFYDKIDWYFINTDMFDF
jgi:hypothetical protein